VLRIHLWSMLDMRPQVQRHQDGRDSDRL
jgi:hypothetical protein